MSSNGRPPAQPAPRRPGRPPSNPSAASTPPSQPAGGMAGSASPAPRLPSGTHSLLPSRASSVSRTGQTRMVFRPKLPPPRPIKEDPDGPSASPASGSTSPVPAAPSAPSLSHMQQRPPLRRPTRPSQPEMTASGPFAQGSGAASRRDHSRSGRSGGSGVPRQGLLSNLSMDGLSGASSSRMDYREPDKATKKEREDYSDPEDDGIEIVDMEDVDKLDELAPRALPRMKREDGKRPRSHTPKDGDAETSHSSSREASVALGKDAASRQADALDLSASEEEEVMDDLLEDFLGSDDGFEDDPENRLYLFQFPPLFPKFVAPSGEEDQQAASGSSHAKPRRSVAFADDTAGGGGAAGASPKDTFKLKQEDRGPRPAGSTVTGADLSADARPPEGQVGRLDVFRDGRVNFRFGNGLVMEVTGGSQSSFLQQVMILDAQQMRATTIGELHRKFVVAPEITSMLADADLANTSGRTTDDGDAEGMEKIA